MIATARSRLSQMETSCLEAHCALSHRGHRIWAPCCVTCTAVRPNGALVQTPNGGVYVIQNNQKRWITSPLVLNTWSDFSDVIPISDDEGKAYVDGPQVGFRSGKLIAYGGAVYFITNDGGDWYRG